MLVQRLDIFVQHPAFDQLIFICVLIGDIDIATFVRIGILRTDMVTVYALEDRVCRELKVSAITYEPHIQRSSRSLDKCRSTVGYLV